MKTNREDSIITKRKRCNVSTGQLYKHFKGNYYVVRGFATDSETDKPVVIYQALYLRDKAFKIWVRPLEMFIEDVNKPDYKGSRFKHIKTKYSSTIQTAIMSFQDDSLTEEFFRTTIETLLKETSNKQDGETISMTFTKDMDKAMINH